jgi:hypothetical protein
MSVAASGTRALNDFKNEHKWTVPNDSAGNHRCPLDLANQEYIDNSHGVDKHIGKTDAQLAQQLRDQTNIPAASTFKNLTDAQKFTQLAIDKNQDAISDYLNSGPPYHPPNKPFTYLDPQGPVTGSSITKNEYQQALAAHREPNAAQSHGVHCCPYSVTTPPIRSRNTRPHWSRRCVPCGSRAREAEETSTRSPPRYVWWPTPWSRASQAPRSYPTT